MIQFVINVLAVDLNKSEMHNRNRYLDLFLYAFAPDQIGLFAFMLGSRCIIFTGDKYHMCTCPV